MWLDNVLARSPLQNLSQWRYRRQLKILGYHGINHPERFEQQIKYIANKMHPIALEDLMSAVSAGRELPEHAVLVTFDDGERSIFEVGMPILQKYGVPAIVFVITDLVDTDKPFWWHEVKWLVTQGARLSGMPDLGADELVRRLKRFPNAKRVAALTELRLATGKQHLSQRQLRREELQKLESAGIVVGNHTHTHPALDRVNDNDLVHEITTAHNFLATTLGHAPKVFAFPYGYENEKARSLLPELGYTTGFLFDHRVSQWPIKSPYRISRLRVNSTDLIDRFAIVLSGLHPMIHHMIGRT